MDFKKIQELIKLVDESNISEVKVEQDAFKLNIRTKHYHAGQTTVATVAPVASQPAPAPTPAPGTPAEAKVESPAADASNDNLITIKAPMIGTFYRRPSPDKDIYVNVGDTVKEGDVLCIIEAMKLFNEIESEVSGKIVKVLVEDSSPVEYDQPLFLVDPS